MKRAGASLRGALALALVGVIALAAPPAHAQPRPPTAETKAPVLREAVEPTYPAEERAAGREATVVLVLTVGVDGAVEDAAVQTSGGAAFDAAALEAARRLRFAPAEVGGVATRVRILYRQAFTIEEEAPTTARFSGVVRDAVTGAPVEGASVDVEGASRVTTGPDGRFALPEVAPGLRRVRIEAPGQTPVFTEETFEAGRQLDAVYDLGIARTPEASDGPTEDFEIVVTAPPLAKDVTSVEVGQEEARRVPGTQGDVLQVVRSLPGVSRAAAGSGALVVWGAAPEDTRVYVEGVRIPLLYHLGGVRSVVQTDLVKGVELAPGGWGASYGRGLGGLVTVDLVPLEGEVAHGSASVDLLDLAASARAPVGGPVHAAAGARWGWAHRLVPVATDRDVGELFAVPQYLDGQLRVGVHLAPRARLEVGALGAFDEVTRTVGSRDPTAVRGDERAIAWGRLYARLDAQLEDGGEVTITPWYGRDDVSATQRYGAVTTRVETTSDLLGLRASYRARWLEEGPESFLGVTTTMGVDVEAVGSSVVREGSIGVPFREGDARVFGQAPPAQIGSDAWSTWTGSPAPYVEADVSLAEGAVHVVPGLRIEPFAVSASRQSPVVGRTPSIGLFDQELAVAPRLAAKVRVAEPVVARAAWGLYHQQAAPEDLSAVFGSPTLGLSRAQHLLGGVNVTIAPGLDVDAIGWLTLSDDLTVRSARDSPLLARALVQTGQGRAFGAQLLVRRQLADGFFGWVSYGLSRSERRASEDDPYRLFDFDQTHVLTAVASLALPWGLELGSRFRLASGVPRTEVVGTLYDARTDAYAPVFGALNEDRLPAFVQLDARLSKTLRFGRASIEAYVDVQNVTNQENVEDWVYSADFSERGEITGVPLLPVVGVRSSW